MSISQAKSSGIKMIVLVFFALTPTLALANNSISLLFNVTDHLEAPIQGQIEATITNTRTQKSAKTGKILVLGDNEPNPGKVDLSVKPGDSGTISIRFSPAEEMYSDFLNSPINEEIRFRHSKTIPSLPDNGQMTVDVRLMVEKRTVTAESKREAIDQLVDTDKDFKKFSATLEANINVYVAEVSASATAETGDEQIKTKSKTKATGSTQKIQYEISVPIENALEVVVH